MKLILSPSYTHQHTYTHTPSHLVMPLVQCEDNFASDTLERKVQCGGRLLFPKCKDNLTIYFLAFYFLLRRAKEHAIWQIRSCLQGVACVPRSGGRQRARRPPQFSEPCRDAPGLPPPQQKALHSPGPVDVTDSERRMPVSE